jgi:YHS domain-containing protein
MKKLLVISMLLAAIAATPIPAKTLVNKEGDGLALQGYDPVAFFTEGKPIPGRSSITSSFDGATYRFATDADRAAFDKEPEKYAPAFGGYCAMGVAYEHLVPVKIETWQILDGRLVLNNSLDVKALFDKDHAGNLRKAEGNWPGLLDKNGM